MVRNRQKFLETADSLGEYICKRSFWDGNRCNWVGRVVTRDSYDRPACTALDIGLYSGTCGVALFLGQLFECTRNELYRKTAEGGIRQALSRCQDLEEELRFSLFRGLIGLAYTAAKVGDILDNQGFVNQALKMVSILKVQSPDYYLTDVISGVAGAIPALLYLYRKHEDKNSLDLATRFGFELISSNLILFNSSTLSFKRFNSITAGPFWTYQISYHEY